MAVENVVMIYEVGNGKGCDHGKSRFVIDTVLSDMRLTGRIPQEKVREKFEAVNEGFGKCTNHSAWFLVIYIPMCIAGAFFFLSYLYIILNFAFPAPNTEIIETLLNRY